MLAHRGPDGAGEWRAECFHLLHRRLAVIDLATGDQPMASADGRQVIVFNGEIYNYRELRSELISSGHVFRTTSDTEVVLNGWREWGIGLPVRLEGMFAFAIADVARGSLFVARDRFGEKPLFVHDDQGVITVASTLGGVLAALPALPRVIAPGPLSSYLCLNYVPGEATLIAGIERLPPATWRLWDHKSQTSGRYWNPAAVSTRPTFATLGAAAEALAPVLDRAVERALRADTPVTLFLSGGIDSSLVAESARRQGGIRDAFCLDIAESGHGEYAGAERVARRLGLNLHRVEMQVTAVEDFTSLVRHADDPLADSSALAMWSLARMAGRDYKVALSGDGGDEFFGGYLTYSATLLHGRLISRLPAGVRRLLARLAPLIPVGAGKVPLSYKLWRFLRAAPLPTAEAHFTWNGTWLPAEACVLLGDATDSAPARSALARVAAAHRLTASPALRDLQLADLADYFPNDILVKADRMTMAHGMEARAPLLTPEVAEFGLALPERFKSSAFGTGKRVLRRLAAQRLGEDIARAPKQGFSIPVHSWLRGPARPLVEEFLGRSALRALPWLDAAAIQAVKQRHMEGREQRGFELWGLMVLSAWIRQTGAVPSPDMVSA
jgi:asparagine synthase (glutamine-hydrolysing)